MSKSRRLVVVFLRGGADGLALVPPVADPAYYDARPTVAIPEPGSPDGALPLDGTFGLHPAMASLMPLYERGELAVLHAVGSDDTTRSHFEAQDRMERACTGTARASRGARSGIARACRRGASGADGWVARHLRTRPGPPPGALTAVALSPSIPLALQGTPATAVASLGELPALEATRRAALAALWSTDRAHPELPVGLVAAGEHALSVADRVRAAAAGSVDGLPDTDLGRALADVVRLVRADVGLEVAHIDVGGWDTHFVQAGIVAERAGTLADGLAGLPGALGDAWRDTAVVVLTEFGRRVVENTSLGTDHGRGSVAFVLGGSIAGGRVLTDWPGLAGRDPDVRDLLVTLDFRHVLAEVVDWLGNDRTSEVFLDFDPRPQGLFST